MCITRAVGKAGYENAGHEKAGCEKTRYEISGCEMAGMKCHAAIFVHDKASHFF